MVLSAPMHQAKLQARHLSQELNCHMRPLPPEVSEVVLWMGLPPLTHLPPEALRAHRLGHLYKGMPSRLRRTATKANAYAATRGADYSNLKGFDSRTDSRC